MESTYREDSFPRVRRKVLIRGFVNLVVALLVCSIYFLNVEWYFSVLPGVLLLLYSFGDIFGVKAIEKARRNTRIAASEKGLVIDMGQNTKPLHLSWPQIKMGKVKSNNGKVISFGIRLHNSPINTFEFSNDLTHFDELWKTVNAKANV